MEHSELAKLAGAIAKVKEKANLTADVIYEESFMVALTDLPAKTPKDEPPRWFSYYYGRTHLKEQAIQKDDLNLVQAKPAASNTRKSKAHNNMLLEEAVAGLRQVRSPELKLRFPHDISPIPGIILFAFQHPSYYFHPSAFCTPAQYHRTAKMALYLIEEQAAMLAGIAEIEKVPVSARPQAKWQKYASLEADADSHLKECVVYARQLQQLLLMDPLDDHVVKQMLDVAAGLMEELKSETAFRRASARLITHTAGFEVAYHRIMTEMRRGVLFKWLATMRQQFRTVWQPPADSTPLRIAYEQHNVLSFPKVYGYNDLKYPFRPDATAHVQGPLDYAHIPDLIQVGPPQYVFDVDLLTGTTSEKIQAPLLLAHPVCTGPHPQNCQLLFTFLQMRTIVALLSLVVQPQPYIPTNRGW